MDIFSEFLLDEDVLADDESDDEDTANARTYDEEDDEDEESYEVTLREDISGVYIDEDGVSAEYRVRYDEPEHAEIMQDKQDDKPREYSNAEHEEHSVPLTDYHNGIMTMEDTDYHVMVRSDVMNIEYEAPEMINGQATYQRIVFEADADGESIYELTKRKLAEAGIEHSDAYDPRFSSRLFTSINNKAEGAEGNFNEFYLNGEIGENAADRQTVKKGDVVEWRYAEETDGSCGGVPDFSKIKELYQYSMGVRNGMLSMQQIYGLLS